MASKSGRKRRQREAHTSVPQAPAVAPPRSSPVAVTPTMVPSQPVSSAPPVAAPVIAMEWRAFGERSARSEDAPVAPPAPIVAEPACSSAVEDTSAVAQATEVAPAGVSSAAVIPPALGDEVHATDAPAAEPAAGTQQALERIEARLDALSRWAAEFGSWEAQRARSGDNLLLRKRLLVALMALIFLPCIGFLMSLTWQVWRAS